MQPKTAWLEMPLLFAVVGANLSVSGATLAGGADAAAITAADAEGNALGVLGVLAFGDLTSASSELTLANINAALIVGAITAAQLPEVLDILAGRQYVAPVGTVIETGGVFGVSPAVGAPGGPRFVVGTNRQLFLNDGLPLSFAVGELAGFTDSSFVYAGVPGDPNGEAVVVFNDDGTFFTP